MTQIVAETVSAGEATAEAGDAANTLVKAAEAVAVAVAVAEAVAVTSVEIATVTVRNAAAEAASAEAITARNFVEETVAPPLDNFAVIGSIAT